MEYASNLLASRARQAKLDHPEWRWGQAVFNTAYVLYPEFTNRMRGSLVDPFYNDENIADFLAELDKWNGR